MLLPHFLHLLTLAVADLPIEAGSFLIVVETAVLVELELNFGLNCYGLGMPFSVNKKRKLMRKKTKTQLD